MPAKRFSNLIGLDDAPFAPDHTGPVAVVGAVFTGLRLTGVVIGQVDKDGTDAAAQLARLVGESKFAEHLQLILLQGITLAGFNVVDVFALHEALKRPILVVSRRQPDLTAVKAALLGHIEGGAKKWTVIEQLGPAEPVGQIYVQRVGLSIEEAAAVVDRFAVHSHLPEPLRTAHLIAGAVAEGQSRGQA